MLMEEMGEILAERPAGQMADDFAKEHEIQIGIDHAGFFRGLGEDTLKHRVKIPAV